MKAIVTYDANGNIVAIAMAATDLPSKASKNLKISPIPAEGHQSVEIELPNQLAGTPLRDIHNEYRLDLVTSKLLKRAPEITI